MKRSTLFSLIALAVAVAGLAVALTAFFKRNRCTFCDDFEDESMPEFAIDPEEEESDDLDIGPDEDGCPDDDCAGCPESCCAQEEIPADAVVETEEDEKDKEPLA